MVLLRCLLVSLGLAGGFLLSACSLQPQPKALTPQEVEQRIQEHFNRGNEQFNRGEFKAALESFRTARAYDAAGTYPDIAAMIEKTEAKLRIPPGQPTTVARSQPAAPPPPTAPPAPTPTAGPEPKAPAPTARPAAKPTAPPATAAPSPRLDVQFKVYRSAIYPYSIEIPEDWGLGPNQPDLAGLPVEVLAAPGTGPVATDLGTLALPLAADVDGRAFYEAMRKGLRGMGIDPVEVGKRQVDGAEARLMRASVADHQGKHTATMVMFEADRIGWLIMFTTAPDQSDRLQPLFHRMLDSFRIGNQSRVI